ncbi:uncharacterized protein LOC129918617 [Episyrphus balteatus]|uniref:uncharacterized protein LOC129918617 n=1 Tax=Episyrphus balteatus TaxID=286459 RepID=UPI0024864294|nr:uncharacterized protein LOC129918617 [Episyrphus balteatus]
MSVNKFVLILIALCTLLNTIHRSEAVVYRLITETLQNNIAGEPITHERTNWDFNPDISKARRGLFYEKHGFRASKFIESLGIGIDGREQERRQEQQIRDIGKLNGEHYRNSP